MTSRGSEVKESIVVLCRMFKYGDIFQKITPEQIRQAKFDKPEAVKFFFCILILSKLHQFNFACTSMNKFMKRSYSTYGN